MVHIITKKQQQYYTWFEKICYGGKCPVELTDMDRTQIDCRWVLKVRQCYT